MLQLQKCQIKNIEEKLAGAILFSKAF